MDRWIIAAIGCFLFAQGALAAQAIDCAGPIQQAQKAIDKVVGDLQDMEKMMPKSEMSELHGLVVQAKELNKEAQQSCSPKNTAYSQAQAIARATSANGYATAADILHFHYMEASMGGGTMKGESTMGKMPGMSGMSGK